MPALWNSRGELQAVQSPEVSDITATMLPFYVFPIKNVPDESDCLPLPAGQQNHRCAGALRHRHACEKLPAYNHCNHGSMTDLASSIGVPAFDASLKKVPVCPESSPKMTCGMFWGTRVGWWGGYFQTVVQTEKSTIVPTRVALADSNWRKQNGRVPTPTVVRSCQPFFGDSTVRKRATKMTGNIIYLGKY